MVDEFQTRKRHLPHWEDPGGVYCITFRTFGQNILSDHGKDITFLAVKYHADRLYKLYACVAMSTHIHIILQPLEAPGGSCISLARIMHSIKSYSSKEIQKSSDQQGVFWQDEYYDRLVRTDYDFEEKMNYIIYNPMKAGLENNPAEYEWLFYEGQD